MRGPKANIGIDGRWIDPGALTSYTLSHQTGESPHFIFGSEHSASIALDSLARVAVADVPAPGPAAAIFLDATGAVDAADDLGRDVLAVSELVPCLQRRGMRGGVAGPPHTSTPPAKPGPEATTLRCPDYPDTRLVRLLG